MILLLAVVIQKCKYYYRLEPVFGKYLDFPSMDDPGSFHTPPPKKPSITNNNNSPSLSSPVSSPALIQPPSSSHPTTVLSNRSSLYNLIESVLRNQQRDMTNSSNRVNTQGK